MRKEYKKPLTRLITFNSQIMAASDETVTSSTGYGMDIEGGYSDGSITSVISKPVSSSLWEE